MVILLLAVALGWVALYDSNRFVVREYVFRHGRIKKPLTLVFLSDLHNKQYGPGNIRLLEAIEALNPQAILVGGDMLVARPGRAIDTPLTLLEPLAAKYPLFYAYGNHEYRLELYPEKYKDMHQRYALALHAMGIRLLRNRGEVFGDSGVAVYGLEIEREYYRRFVLPQLPVSKVEAALGEASDTHFNLLLAHNPDYFPQYARWGAELTLSGHIHGGVVRLFGKGLLSPRIHLWPRYDGGVFSQGERHMVVSRGLGMHTPPFRLWNPAELVCLRLLPEVDGSGE